MPNAYPYIEEGMRLLRWGKMDRAMVRFERALHEVPDSAIALSYFGLSLALGTDNGEEGEEHCFRAAMRAPRDGQIQANLARVYFLRGKRQSAASAAHEALRLDAKNADARLVLRRLGLRRRPVMGFLGRNHPLNRVLGRLRHQLRSSAA